MANMFALILVIATLVTGLLWCLDKFIFAPKRRDVRPLLRQRPASNWTKNAEESGPETGLAGNWRLGLPGAGDCADCCVRLSMNLSRSRQVR